MKNYNAQSGFSLIEVLLAMTIFSIGLLVVITMQVTALQGNFSSRVTTEATILAQEKVEEFYILPYTHADLTAGNHGPISEGNYTYSWRVADDTVIANTKTITLTVQYSLRGANKNVQIVTVKSSLI